MFIDNCVIMFSLKVYFDGCFEFRIYVVFVDVGDDVL